MLTKKQKYIQRQWIKGPLDISQMARRMGYRGESLSKGMLHVQEILTSMHLSQ